LSEQQQQEEKPFFVALCLETRYCHVDRHRGNNNDCLLVLIEGFDQFPERDKFFLKLIELRRCLLR